MAATKGRKLQVPKSPDSLLLEKDIVPGKISIREWEELLEVEDGINTVCELVEELVERASDVVYQRYIEEAAFPYAVQDAKDFILRTLAMEFLGRDDGEQNTDTDPTWLEEEEPFPSPIDSWACGMVPSVSQELLRSSIEAMPTVEILQPAPSSLLHTNQISLRKSRSGMLEASATPSTPVRIVTASTQLGTPDKSPPTTNKVTKARGRPVARHHRMVVLDRAPSEDLEEPGQDEEEQQVVQPSPVPDMGIVSHTPFGLKPVQLKWMKEVKYDQNGRIIDMVKLDPAKFPSHRMKPVVSLVQPPKTQPPSNLRRRNTKLKPLSSSKAFLLPPPHPPDHSNCDPVNTTTKSTKRNKVKSNGLDMGLAQEAETGSERSREARTVTVMPSACGLSWEASARRFPEMPALPPLVDTIDPLPGVTVREGGRSVQGPTPTSQFPVTPREGLRPLNPPAPTVSAEGKEGKGGGRKKKGGKKMKEKCAVEFVVANMPQHHNNGPTPTGVTS